MGLQQRRRSGSCNGSVGDRKGMRPQRSQAETIRGELVELERRERAPSQQGAGVRADVRWAMPGAVGAEGTRKSPGWTKHRTPTSDNRKYQNHSPRAKSCWHFAVLCPCTFSPLFTPTDSWQVVPVPSPLQQEAPLTPAPMATLVSPLTSCPCPVFLSSSPQTHCPPTPSPMPVFCSACPPPAAILLCHHCPFTVPHFPPAFPPTSSSCFCLSDLPSSLSWLFWNTLILLPGWKESR